MGEGRRREGGGRVRGKEEGVGGRRVGGRGKEEGEGRGGRRVGGREEGEGRRRECEREREYVRTFSTSCVCCAYGKVS